MITKLIPLTQKLADYDRIPLNVKAQTNNEFIRIKKITAAVVLNYCDLLSVVQLGLGKRFKWKKVQVN